MVITVRTVNQDPNRHTVRVTWLPAPSMDHLPVTTLPDCPDTQSSAWFKLNERHNFTVTIRYDTIGEFKVDWKAEYCWVLLQQIHNPTKLHDLWHKPGLHKATKWDGVNHVSVSSNHGVNFLTSVQRSAEEEPRATSHYLIQSVESVSHCVKSMVTVS